MLDRLPSEILYHILIKLRARDVGRIAQLNRHFAAHCSSSWLWHELFHAHYDPVVDGDLIKYDYAGEMKRRESATIWFESDRRSPSGKLDALETMVDIAETRRADNNESKNERWLERLIDDDVLGDSTKTRADLHSVGSDEPDKGTRRRLSQAIAHLKVLRLEPETDEARLTRYKEIVYENKFYLSDSSWGPFTGRGPARRVDWVKLEAIMHCMRANIRLANEDWSTEVPGTGWKVTRPFAQEGEDWSGLSKTVWHGTYAFIDYRVYEHYNFHRNGRYTPTLEGEIEAVGNLMKLQLSLLPADGVVPADDRPVTLATVVEALDDSDDEEDDEFEPWAPSDDGYSSSDMVSEHSHDHTFEEAAEAVEGTPPSSPPDESSENEAGSGDSPSSEGPHRRLSFSGSSEQDASLGFVGNFAPTPTGPVFRRAVRGTVTRLRDGQVHYRWVISYGGADQWLLNGVQVGGVGSKAGIMGIWSTADHDESGPNGPFVYWPSQQPMTA